MVAQLVYLRERGRGRLQPGTMAGLPVLRAALYDPPGLARWRLEGRLRRLEGRLVRAGAGRAALPEGFPYAGLLQSLRPVDPMPFWRALADRLVLAALERAGLDPRRSRVALSAPRLCSELRQAAERLRPHVRGLLIDVPELGADYARWLHLRYGLPVTPPSAGAAATAAFGPGGGRWGTVLELYGQRPELAGLRVSAPGLELPAGYEGPALALLWEQGALDREGLTVR